jgi:hypothetical protein
MFSWHIVLTESISPGSTRGVLLELAGVENALVDVRTRQDISSPHSPASDKESSEAHTGDSATSPSNNQSANVEKQPVLLIVRHTIDYAIV